MTRLYRLNPIAAGSRGRNIGITLPPVANGHAETDYSTSTGGLTWGYLDAVVRSITEEAHYVPHTFSAAPTDWPVIWEWTAGDSDLLCQIINTSGFPINHSVLDFTVTISGLGSSMTQTITSSAGNDTLLSFFVLAGRTVTLTMDQVQTNPVSFQIRTATIPAE
jgi:hypothetical protein